MTLTPWGDSEKLRARQLRPGPSASPEEVAHNQRERLFAAMVAVSAAEGYERTSVTQLVETSGVSRATFYKYFPDKKACFLATLEETLSTALAITAAGLRHDGSWEERVEQGVKGFVELLVGQSAAARLCLIESYVAGPEAVDLVDAGIEGFRALMSETFEELPDWDGMPADMTQAMTGGLRKVLHTRLNRGTEGELLGLVPEILELGLSYRPPPGELRVKRPSKRTNARTGPTGGHEETDPAARIMVATLKTVAARGYPATKLSDIVQTAETSLSTFYGHFDGKAEALDAALYDRRARMLGTVLPAWRRAKSWPDGIRAVTEALLVYMEREPEFAQLICIGIYAAGPDALERRDLAIDAVQRLMDEGIEYRPDMKPLWPELIISTLYAILCDRVKQRGVQNLRGILPLCTYMALSPFIGPEAAYAMANGASWSQLEQWEREPS